MVENLAKPEKDARFLGHRGALGRFQHSVRGMEHVDAKDRSFELWAGRYENSLWELVGAATFDKTGVVVDGDLSLVTTMVLMDVTGVTEQPEATKGSGEATLTGTVLNADGTAFEGGRVQFCRDGECVTATTDSGGEYEMSGLSVGRGSFEVIPVG